jgi:DNA-binding NtrC family response regulator
MRYRVLIVDDEPNLLSGLRQVLHAEPYDLVTDSDPAHAIQRMRTEELHVVVSDHRMAGVTGTELLATARELLPHAVRFLMTGAPSLAMALDAINAGAVSRIFLKPFPAIVLASAIRQAMENMETLRLAMRVLDDARHLSSVLEAVRQEHPKLIERLEARRTLKSGATAAEEYFPQDPQAVLAELRRHFH